MISYFYLQKKKIIILSYVYIKIVLFLSKILQCLLFQFTLTCFYFIIYSSPNGFFGNILRFFFENSTNKLCLDNKFDLGCWMHWR